MEHRRLGVVAFLLVAAVMSLSVQTASAVGGSSTPQRVEAAGVSLEYPGTWTEVPRSRRELRAAEAKLAKRDPDLAARLRAEAKSLPPGARFGAAELDDTPSGYHSAIVVQLVPRSLPSSDDVAARRADLERRGYTVATSTPVFGSATGVRIDMTKPSVAPDGTAVALLVTELLVPLGNRTAMIDVRTVDDAAGHSVVDAIQASVRPS